MIILKARLSIRTHIYFKYKLLGTIYIVTYVCDY
jgi:hypothetical protein